MQRLAELWRRVLFLLRRGRFDREMSEEMRFHLEMKAEENVERGMTPEEALYAARRQFGNQALLQEASREVWSFVMIETLLKDVRYAARVLLKSPAFTAVAVLTLAIGIGANTAIFSVTNALILRPFDFPDLDRLVTISGTTPQQGGEYYPLTPADYADLRQQQTVFADLAAYRHANATLTAAPGEGEPERLQKVEASPELIRLLGAGAALGRTFLPEEEQAGRDQVAVLSHDLWQRRFGADQKIIGTTISLDGEAYTIIGVMPASFSFPKPAKLWTPLALSNETWSDRRDGSLSVVARLKTGVGLAQADAEVRALARRLASQYPQTNSGRDLTVRLLREGANGEYNEVFLSLLMAAVGFVLLIACVNIANMQLARVSGRGRELAIRAALGAGRLALMRQLLVESLLLGLIGGVCGLLVAFWLLDFIRGSLPPETIQYVEGWQHITINGHVLLFALVITLASSLVSGLAPALQFSRPDLNETLREGGRSGGAGAARQRLRKALIVAEVALALVLLVGAGLMVKGFGRLTEKEHQGFDPRHVLTLRTVLPPSRYTEARQVAAFYRQAEERLSSLPGVESATTTRSLPGTDDWGSVEFQTEGQPAPPGQARVISSQQVGADYFKTVRIPILKGRAFSTSDGLDAPRVAVINEAAARRYFPDEDPLGRRIKAGAGDSAQWYTIVGVAGDVSRFMFDRETQPMLYLPDQQVIDRGAYFVLRTRGEPLDAVLSVRAQINALDDKLPLFDIKSHEQAIDENLAGLRLAAALMAMFGTMALVLAAVGVYGVMAYAVSQRTQEIGLRMALGAQERDVFRLVVGQALKLAALGLAIGLPSALALGRLMASALFGTVALDAPTFVEFTLLLTCAALLAGYLPARRATKVDPMVALRYE